MSSCRRCNSESWGCWVNDQPRNKRNSLQTSQLNKMVSLESSQWGKDTATTFLRIKPKCTSCRGMSAPLPVPAPRTPSRSRIKVSLDRHFSWSDGLPLQPQTYSNSYKSGEYSTDLWLWKLGYYFTCKMTASSQVCGYLRNWNTGSLSYNPPPLLGIWPA